MMSSFVKRHRFLIYGAPFMAMLVGGSFGLQQFAQLRYTFRKNKQLSPAEVEALSGLLKEDDKRPTIETELEKLKEADLDNWQNIRGPRPWEDSKTVQDEQRKAMQT